MSNRRTRAFWEAASAKVAAGQTLEVVSRQLGVKRDTLAWWCWRLRRDRREEQPPKVPRKPAAQAFLPVVVRNSAPASIELAVDDVLVRVPVGTDPGYVAALAQALRSRC